MANCILCSKELKFINTPTFGAGKLSDGSTVCTACYKKINNANASIGFKLKKYALIDIQNLLQEKSASAEQSNFRLDEIKKQIHGLKLSNISTFFGRREINELPNILAPTETIDNLAQGMYNNGQGILVSTNRRLIQSHHCF